MFHRGTSTQSEGGGGGGLANLDIIFKMEYQLTILELYKI